MTAVVEGVRAAAEKVGLARVRAARHRVEHAEMLTPETIAAFAELGLTASVQPAFDALWGGEDGMYAQRLGAERARTLNPFAALLQGRRPARLRLRQPGHARSTRGARSAPPPSTARPSTASPCAPRSRPIRRGGWRAIGRDDAGVLVPGAPADYAVWRTDELVVQAPDDRVARWSTDPRSGTPGLPDLTPGPTCPSACAPWWADGRCSYGRASDLPGWRGADRRPAAASRDLRILGPDQARCRKNRRSNGC